MRYDTTVTSPCTYLNHHTYMHRHTHIQICWLVVLPHCTSMAEHSPVAMEVGRELEGRQSPRQVSEPVQAKEDVSQCEPEMSRELQKKTTYNMYLICTCMYLRLHHRMVLYCEYLLIVNCEFFLYSQLSSINMPVYYKTVQGRPSQLLDSQFGLTCLKCIH